MRQILASATIPSAVMCGFGTTHGAVQLEECAQRSPVDPTARLLNRPRIRIVVRELP
jgi:hypothetical protein